MRRHATGLLFAAGLVLSLSACAAQQETRGYVPDEDRIAEVVKGVHDRNSVERLLGSPSAVSTFENSTWYYITRKTEKVAFFDEEVTDQQVVAVVFDDAGIVSDIRRYTLEDGQEVALVDRETPTRGRELTILEQLLGNLGRFSPRDQ